jgi:hypothetical protein
MTYTNLWIFSNCYGSGSDGGDPSSGPSHGCPGNPRPIGEPISSVSPCVCYRRQTRGRKNGTLPRDQHSLPLRRQVQAFVDRRFYRRKYDAAKTLQVFSSRLRDETDLDMLDDHVVGVVVETMQPAHFSLWLRPDPSQKRGGDKAPRGRAGL